MRIIPVLDIKEGKVVGGMAGRRQAHGPVVSRLTQSALPLDVASAFRMHFGLNELYVADLDAIAGSPPATPIFTTLRADGFRLWVDAGVRDVVDTLPLAAAGLEGIVVGLETVRGPAVLESLCLKLGSERLIFSLDLKHGKHLRGSSVWEDADDWSIAAEAVARGVRRLMVLDLARVGVNEGMGTEGLCARLVRAFPEVEVTAGGGVRDVADLRRLRELGVSGVLMASALHDGRVSRGDLETIV